jgi:hypothetical protein
MERPDQISVPVDADMRAAVERVAKLEQRKLAEQVRYWITRGLADYRMSETGRAA